MVNYFDDNHFYTEAEKSGEEYLVGCTDRAISDLVKEKRYLKKAYNYYQGFRDLDQFRHIEENYGIGNPTSVEFIPLIRRHVDALVGEHLQNKIKPNITCKDNVTLSKIERQKQLAIYNAEIQTLKGQLADNIFHLLQTEEEKAAKKPPVDVATEKELSKLKESVGKNFISEFEKAAQYVLTHLIQSKSVDLHNKLKALFLDILIAGQCYYKVKILRLGDTPKIEILSPFDVFSDKIPDINSSYVKHSPRIVVRKWKYKDQILNEYGQYFNDENIKELHDLTTDGYEAETFYIRNNNSGGILENIGVGVNDDYDSDNQDGYYRSRENLIAVYEVEWLTTNPIVINGETIYRMDRYKSTRIGEDIYIDMGPDDSVIRSVENPYECSNSINGVYYTNRNGKPYSLVLATANLQDKYDVLHFYRDILIANSGVKGDWIDTANLPTFLGNTPQERLLKFKAYKKQGLALINTAQEGRGANHNTIFGGFDDTLPGQAVQSIQFAIQQTEETCSAVTGVFRERLGNIEQKDAVTNVQVGIETSAVITKQYYQMMDSITTELLIDALNACKESYKEGKIGSIILGDKMQEIFKIQPENFSFTDYDVHIGDSGDIIRDMQKIEAITMELIKSGQADVEVVLEGVTSESLTEMKQSVLTAFNKKKEEMSQMSQMQQQLQQMEEQLKAASQQAQKLQQENEMLKKRNVDIEVRKIEYDHEVRKEANLNTKVFNDGKLEIEREKIEIEKLQLTDENPLNDEVKY